MERKQQIIEGLLAKPSKKPDFTSFKGSEVLKRAQEFIPMFIQTTDRLLTDPELLKRQQMDIEIVDKDGLQQEDVNEDDDNTEEQKDTKLITMDIGVGVYDIENEDFNEKNFKPSSSVPVVRVKGINENMLPQQNNEEDDEGDSDDSQLYYEFDSDSEHGEAFSSTTKSTAMNTQKRPMIVDITPTEEIKKTLNVSQQQKKKNNKKRKRQV